ncbi:hypothetical protein HPP92_013235 [Vanilla planifolia]|uniref:C3H1-type domain-containing protein n=1 Tax=Vanilla planifolia TaxID=51239 RepID=A0A835QWN3_VANPL|nr:hypothetical protein HPP92_013235 [Vanilla planifolia]
MGRLLTPRSPNQLSPSANAYPSPYTLAPSVGLSTGGQNEQNLPQRPGLPVCRFYMRTGECKFGATCKYHHPPDWSIPSKNCTLNPLGLPLRPGVQLCAYYSQHGVCKFGPTCKFDHPIGTLGYNPSSSSLVDIPVAPYPIGLSMPTLAPSSLMEQRPALHSSNDAFSAQTSVKHTPNVSAAV